MLTCRPVGSTTFTVADFANRFDVLTDTGVNSDITHRENGAGWYYNGNWSWGFAKTGDPVFKDSCDVNRPENRDKRLCWHTSGGSISLGFSCGATDFIFDSSWERVILHHD